MYIFVVKVIVNVKNKNSLCSIVFFLSIFGTLDHLDMINSLSSKWCKSHGLINFILSKLSGQLELVMFTLISLKHQLDVVKLMKAT